MPFNHTVVPPECHSISFFKDDAQLCSEVGAFVAEGLALGQPALVVTTPGHRSGIAAELNARGADVEAAVAAGDLVMADAEETLAALMAGDMPNAALYHERVGTAVADLLRGRPGPVRIFGDMVDLLWQRRQFDAAIRIEILSNQLAALHPIAVICGYSMGHFLKTAMKLQEVRALHGSERTRDTAAQRPLAKRPRRSRARLRRE